MQNIQLDESYVQDMESMSISDFEQYNLNGRWIVAKVLRVHDTDTFTIGWKECDRFVKTNVRLIGLDAPELRSKNNDGKESKLCRLGRNWLTSNYLNKLITVECLEMDKYGRLLGNANDYPIGNISINHKLINNKFARVYGGDLHKSEWTVEELDNGIVQALALGVEDNLN